MADQYNPSFVHPNFVQTDYEVFSGVNFSPLQLTFNNTTPRVIKSYKSRIFNSRAYCKCSWDSFGNTIWGGSSSIVLGFYNDRSTYPYHDYFEWGVIVAARTGGASELRFVALADQVGQVVDTGYFSMPTDDTGDIELWVEVGPDKGSGNCDITFRAVNTKHSINLSYVISNYVPRSEIDEWYSYFQPVGDSTSWGRTILLSNTLLASALILPVGISSDETFGGHDVAFTSQLTITPPGILPQEGFGVPIVSVNGKYVQPIGIASLEAWGFPRLTQPTKVESSLPPPVQAKEGDILFTLESYTGYGDVTLADRDVERDGGFETSVLITLGTDKRVDEGESLPDDAGYKGGWWADGVPVIPGDKIGWKGWLLRREKTTNEAIAKCGEYLADGFQWMFDDGIISDLQYTVERASVDRKSKVLKMSLQFVRPGGQDIFYTFYYNWEEQLLQRG